MPNHRGPILIVEDVPNVLELLTTSLNINGYPVITASNVEEAFKIIESQKPSLVITDILMPKLSGYALVQKIRNDLPAVQIPVIFVSATYTTAEDKKFAISLGGVRFIEKPVDTEDLILTVGEILTQGISTMPRPMSTEEFHRGYRDRLESTLRHKSTQIARAERLLQTLPAEYKPVFESILRNSLSERCQIQQELDAIYQILTNLQSVPGE
jgi:DNA-binding response OmpR family regulator